MAGIATFALGKYQSKLPASRRGEYVSLTTDYIARTLNDFRLKFRAESIKITNCRGDTIESLLYFLGGKGNQKALWRIKGNRVADVNVQNVWLAQLLKTDFVGVIDKGGGDIDALFAYLKK
jgi:ABC-type transporter MlaC component